MQQHTSYPTLAPNASRWGLMMVQLKSQLMGQPLQLKCQLKWRQQVSPEDSAEQSVAADQLMTKRWTDSLWNKETRTHRPPYPKQEMTQTRIPDTRHLAQNKATQTPSTRHPAQNKATQTPNTQHPTPNTQHPTPDTRHPRNHIAFLIGIGKMPMLRLTTN
jgi:thioester reductase-like protein